VNGDPCPEGLEAPVDVESAEFESVDRFLDWQRHLLDDPVEAEGGLPLLGGAALEDEPDEFDA
jgi:hypothetical protein